MWRENCHRCCSLRLRSVQAAAFPSYDDCSSRLARRLPNFRGPSPRRSGFGHAGGGISSSRPCVGAKCAVPRSKLCFTTGVRTNSRILHCSAKFAESGKFSKKAFYWKGFLFLSFPHKIRKVAEPQGESNSIKPLILFGS